MTSRQWRLLRIAAGATSTAWLLYQQSNALKNLTTNFYQIKSRAQAVSSLEKLNDLSQNFLTLEQYLKFWREIPTSKLEDMLETPELVVQLAAQVNKLVGFYKTGKDLKYTNRVEEEILERILLAYISKQQPQWEQLLSLFTLTNTIEHHDVTTSFQSRFMAAYLSLLWQYPLLSIFNDFKAINHFLDSNALQADTKNMFLVNREVIGYSLSKITNFAELRFLFNVYEPAIKHNLILVLLDPQESHVLQMIKNAELNLTQLAELLECVTISQQHDQLGDAQKSFLIALGEHDYINLILTNPHYFNQVLRPASRHYLNRLACGEKPLIKMQSVQWTDKSRPLFIKLLHALCAARPLMPHNEISEHLSCLSYKQTEFDQLLASFSRFKTMEEFAWYLEKILKSELQKHLINPARCAELLYRIDYLFNQWYDKSFTARYQFSFVSFNHIYSPVKTRYYNILNQIYANRQRSELIDIVLDVYIKHYLHSSDDMKMLLDLLGISIYQPSYVGYITNLPELDLYQNGIQAIVSRKLCHDNPASLFSFKNDKPQEWSHTRMALT